LSRRRYLLRSGPDLRVNQRSRSQTLERSKSGGAIAHEGAAVGDWLRDGCTVSGEGFGPSPTSRQCNHREAPASVSAVLAMAHRYGADSHVGSTHRERLRLAVAYQFQPKPAHAL